jgi:outer membrane protein OmpA-like peptidoglycan-associated protein/ABC-type nitrate/sulfonate/bicarbonate transport system substrate-binding protein
MKPLPRALVLAAGVGVLFFAGKFVIEKTPLSAYFAPKPTIPVAVPDKIDLPGAVTATAAGPSGTVISTATAGGASIRVKTIPWNGTAGMHYANAGGLFKARGLNVSVTREDDYAKLIADLAAFAKDPGQGSHFVVIMGDGAPAFAIGANAALKPFGQSVEAIPGIGYSRGEDKCIIADGVEVRGSLIKGYFGDGDINICLKYASDNGIPVNVDPKVYDPNAMNLTNAGSFTEADQAFIASAQSNFTSGAACEDRTNIVTGKSQKVCVTGTATWTPGDSNVFFEFKKMGKSIRVLASTKEYAWQMPTTLVGNKQWIAKNHATVEAFMAAIFEGGEKVRSDNAALMIASAEQAKVYGEQDASYWASMFKGVTEVGPNGKPIELGGSTTNGLADAAHLLGLNGADNLYKKVYTIYGNIAVKFFPEMMPGGLLKYEDVVNTSVVKALLAKSTNVAKAATPTFTGAASQTVAARAVSIEFETGKASFTPKALAVLNDVLDQAAVTSLTVQINGHTDKNGDDDANMALSKARAEAVKKFLMTNAPGNFPAERVITRGFGETMPIGTDAQNRRVEILLRK